jgi:hypothetical protein
LDSKEGWGVADRPSLRGLGPGDYLLVLRGQGPEYAFLTQVPAEQRPRLLPLVEVVQEAGGGERSASGLLQRLCRAWPEPALADTSQLPALSEEAFFEAVGREGAAVVPVAGLDRLVSARIKLARIGRGLGSGVAFRLHCRLAEPPPAALAALAETLDRSGTDPSRADLVLDYGSIRDERPSALRRHLVEVLEGLPEPGRWRSLILAAGSFPRDLSAIPRYSPTTLRRSEWELWSWLRERELPRLPSYGDYGVLHPGAAQASARLPDNVRYTAGPVWQVVRGARSGREEPDQDFLAACVQVLDSQPCGDEFIRIQIQRGTVPDPAQWLAASLLRHLAVVLRQLEPLQG